MRKSTPKVTVSPQYKGEDPEDEEGEESYGEGSFESFESPKKPSIPNKYGPEDIELTQAHVQAKSNYIASMSSFSSNNGAPAATLKVADASKKLSQDRHAVSFKDGKANKQNYSDEEDELEAGDHEEGTRAADVAGMDLETFMGTYQINIGVNKHNSNNGGNNNSGGGKSHLLGVDKEDPSLRPLDGVSPTRGASDREKELLRKFGDNSNPTSPVTSITNAAVPGFGRPSSGSGMPQQFRHIGGKAFSGADALIPPMQRLTSPVVTPAEQGQDDEEEDQSYHDQAAALLARIRGGGAAAAAAETEDPSLTTLQLQHYHRLAGKAEATNGGKALMGNGGRGSTADNAARVDELLAMVEQRTKQGPSGSGQVKAPAGAAMTRRVKKVGHDGGVAEGSTALTTSSTRDTLNKLKERHQQMEFALSGPHIKVPAAREYGMGAPGYFGNGQNKHGGGSKYAKQSSPTYSSSQVELPSSGYGGGYAADGPGPAGQDTMQQYLMQIGSLKKELKHRDDRLQRMTEHSLSLGQTNDNQKSEIARLQEQVRQLQLDLEAKDARMEDSLRLKKKAQKKVKALEESVQNAELAAQEIQRLQEREAALIEAVEALSTQNEDLIKKLKESMQRELAQAAGRTTDGAHGLRYVSTSPPRAQSDTRLQRQAQPPQHGQSHNQGGRARRDRPSGPVGTLPKL